MCSDTGFVTACGSKLFSMSQPVVCLVSCSHLLWQLLWFEVPQVGALHHSDAGVLRYTAHHLTMPNIHAVYLQKQHKRKYNVDTQCFTTAQLPTSRSLLPAAAGAVACSDMQLGKGSLYTMAVQR